MYDPTPLFELTTHPDNFEALALETFRFQAEQCAPYRAYLQLMGVETKRIKYIEQIPFLPIELFKSHEVYSAQSAPEQVFTSSTTTGQTPSRHAVADLSLYEAVARRAFEERYGALSEYAFFALLPGYLEREGSSLIYMVQHFIEQGAGGGFYLNDYERLMADMASHAGKRILIGVSHALLDLVEQEPRELPEGTIVMETGGMKGRREEMSRKSLHLLLGMELGVNQIHSEYGMTELLSQAYSTGDGLFQTPPWMRVWVRNPQDPGSYLPHGEVGGVNIIDLANRHSCSFIQSDDRGIAFPMRKFRIEGRLTGSEIRGCNLMVNG